MGLLTSDQISRLLSNGRRTADGEAIDPFPIVKLFTPDGSATWLITELDPDRPEIAFGLCDLGFGSPELGSLSLTELVAARGPLGLRVEIDRHFEARAPLSTYANAARRHGYIVEDVTDPQQCLL